jgi:LacI family purine nucleotide synthesis repressor
LTDLSKINIINLIVNVQQAEVEGLRKSVRLADIAERLEVSTVTVSNALAGQKGVSDELRDKIKKTAQEMGYRVKAEQGTDEKKILNIGVIISEMYLGDYPSNYWKVYQELSLLAGSYHCIILFEILRHEMEQSKALPLFVRENKVQGLFVIGEASSDYLEFLYQKAGIPIMFLDFMKRDIPVPAVVADNFYGMYKMVNYLIKKGHAQIAYVGTLGASSSITDRYFGYCKALMEHGIEVRKDWVLGDRDMDGQVGNIRLPEDMPTAFACNSDLTAAELIGQLERQGYKVPEDISVAGFDNYLFEGLCDVRITSYQVDVREMVRSGIKSMASQILYGKIPSDLRFVSGRLVEKDSVSAV